MYEERILKEFPQQFQGQETIAVLVRALARQLDELHQVFDALTRMRSVDTAQGAQLDGAGDIVVLTRSDAMRLIKGAITYDIIDDEHYRHYIRYKILKNTSTCTYYDVIAAIQMLWGAQDIEYYEDPMEPATMTITFPEPEGAVELDDIPPIKAAGVGVHIRATSRVKVNQNLYAGSVFRTLEQVRFHPAGQKPKVRQMLYSGCRAMLMERMRVQPRAAPVGHHQKIYAGGAAMLYERISIGKGGNFA